MRTDSKTPTPEDLRREALHTRREYLQTLQGRREVLLREMSETYSLLQGTLLFETEEESLLLDSVGDLRESLSKLDSCLSLLEENIRRVEAGEEV
jgi:hypothetical protein